MLNLNGMEQEAKKDTSKLGEDRMDAKTGWFAHFAHWVAHVTGRPITFFIAVATVATWGITGPLFGYSDTWQLVINTATTIVTFLMVFVIQNTQNRDTIAMQIKLDELIRVTRSASNTLLNLEELDDQELEKLRKDYERLAQEIPRHLERRRARTSEKSPPRKR
jgi:low affinity Fe/Cu permease